MEYEEYFGLVVKEVMEFVPCSMDMAEAKVGDIFYNYYMQDDVRTVAANILLIPDE